MTRWLLFAILAISAPEAALAAPPEPRKIDPDTLIDHRPPGPSIVAGRWQVQGFIHARRNLFVGTFPVCEFSQGERAFSGVCRDPANGQGPAAGVIAGRHVSWKWDITTFYPEGDGGTAWFQGDIGPDGVIRGAWTSTHAPGLKGEFTQTRK